MLTNILFNNTLAVECNDSVSHYVYRKTALLFNILDDPYVICWLTFKYVCKHLAPKHTDFQKDNKVW